MKTLITILLALFMINVSGQIIVEDRWTAPIKTGFNIIKESGADTLLVYYKEWGPWSNLPDSCNSIPSVWIIWSKGQDYYAKRIECDQNISNPEAIVSSMPINFFARHIKDINNRKTDNKRELGYLTDEATEYLIFMTCENLIRLNMTNFQRGDNNWRSLKWINATIQAIDTTKYELSKNNVR